MAEKGTVEQRAVGSRSSSPGQDYKDVFEDAPSNTNNAESNPSKASPSLNRISATSLDDVNLEEGPADNASSRPQSSMSVTKSIAGSGSSQPELPTRPSAKSQAVSWENMAKQQPNGYRQGPPPPPSRKITSPFSWLSRGKTSSTKESTSASSAPPSKAPPNNHISVTSPTTNSIHHPELMLSRLGDGNTAEGPGAGTGPDGKSLRDRFKMQRLKEEAGISSLEGIDENSPDAQSSSAGGTSQGTEGQNETIKNGTGSAQKERGGASRERAPSAASYVDPNLAPGTAAGISAGPPSISESEAPVDWDMWQSLVYEGPGVVAQKSAEELSHAIASGIPSAIRGVVWQVLANSKNEELEAVYEQLSKRTADRKSLKRTETGNTATSSSADTHPDASSTTGSVDADDTTPVASIAPSSRAGSPLPPAASDILSPSSPDSNDTEVMALLQAAKAVGPETMSPEEITALQKLEKTIKRDLGARTSFSKYAASAGLQDGLFRVCKAYALFDKAVGYAQGMNFLVMPLLFNMPEEETFCLLVRLMHHYRLREMFIQDMPGLHLHLYQFQRLLEDLEPALFCHLHRRGVDPNVYATQWFLTLFAYRFPLQLVLRVYDLVLSEGLEGAILRFGIVLMQKNAVALREMSDMAALQAFLKERLFDAYIDPAPSASSILESGFFGSSSAGADKEVYRADALVQDACAVKLTAGMLRAYAAEWEEKVRADKEREAELDGLRAANASLSGRVRALEERIQKFDTEHVQVASELVRTKVENEELREDGEGLRAQIDELKQEVERQPHEVEARLKDEMERIMSRNLEVHNENRALEEQLSDMEKDLVDAKMRYAEINSAHETLKQKWSDLKKAMGD